MAKITPLQIYKYLPQTNSRRCGEPTCMAFASKLIERKKKIEDCPVLDEPQHLEKKKTLIELMTPPVREMILGADGRRTPIGGEEVLYRHELTYFNPTALFIDLHDEMDSKELVERASQVRDFRFVRVGQELTLNGLALRSKSGDPARFGEAVLTLTEKFKLPLILCSYDPEVLEVGVEIAAGKRPLLYAATKENWERLADLSLKHNVPVVASSPGDLQGLVEITENLLDNGVEDLVLDIGSQPLEGGWRETMDGRVMIRRLAIEKKVKPLGFPILGVPMVTWIRQDDPLQATRDEAVLAATHLLRFCDLLILHSLETWSLLPLLTLRQNLYTDPRVPIRVEAGLSPIGSPDENSPVILTSNFALTYYTVAADLDAAKVSCHLLAVDTEGLAVEVSMAGAKFTPEKVQEVLEKTQIREKVKHKTLIIPGKAARISGDLEDQTGWQVLVGPLDSSRIPGFLKEKWEA
jgi:acetyl-CoA decarbonylase/synthase complex subunit gamma